ncbi:NEDD4-binding protein 2-like 2 [Colossoma macropomum]|uniref:NEDD4-binding protein 2-like 2 n=1 Tax=Colossoma macropomum TaxID=42526 RepID=UPI00186549EA|nr:NEDD4-binding protein 2-like 2 [Colossoma macropomum]XP_036420731.1 NEDD4-binding protein 2-like 2 [Colossoma macropomum]
MPNVIPSKSSPPPVSGIVEDPQCPNQETPDQTVLPQQNLLANANVEVKERPLVFPTENPNIYEGNTSRDDGHECGHDKSREEVIKEIAISSVAFIGPACRPVTAIEEELSEFYKELEEINHQDRVDGDTGVNEDVSQSCEPTPNPSPRKEAWGTDHTKAYRPYPPIRPQRDYGNNRKWGPQSHSDAPWEFSDSYNNQGQWQHPPFRLPHGPPRIQFHGPQHFFPPPPPGNPLQRPYFQPQLNDYSHAERSNWSSCQGPYFPLGYDMGLSSPYCSGSFQQQERSSNDWQHYGEQNYQEQDQHQHKNGTPLVLILMRGLPGSGKSTLAKGILSSGPNGLILSTDDYFFQEDGYFFDPTLLGDAHDWNQKRATDAMLRGRSPVIIDNTNVQAWEMKPYVASALECGYRVEFVEPDTSWKCDPAELEKRNKHGVPRETIAKMLDRFELPISVDIVMNSFEPPHKSKERLSKPRGQRRFEDM